MSYFHILMAIMTLEALMFPYVFFRVHHLHLISMPKRFQRVGRWIWQRPGAGKAAKTESWFGYPSHLLWSPLQLCMFLVNFTFYVPLSLSVCLDRRLSFVNLLAITGPIGGKLCCLVVFRTSTTEGRPLARSSFKHRAVPSASVKQTTEIIWNTEILVPRKKPVS